MSAERPSAGGPPQAATDGSATPPAGAPGAEPQPGGSTGADGSPAKAVNAAEMLFAQIEKLKQAQQAVREQKK
jgi:hypothetical protein